ncbi:MAG: T9SS type A sorting domain-containing protein, partial [Saprospiraceae bacterium]|nr:T9SS type A sorting domain-containing protein [Saprospiraceae bacterium]
PAVTPSVADLDNDGEKEIVLSSTGTQYVFDLEGSPEPGWPRPSFPLQRYSFQSPVLVDLDGDEQMEIVGATHGDLPEYYVRTFNGGNFAGWPQSVPGNNWTFSTPTVVRLNGGYRIFMSRPIGEAEDDMLYGWTSDGMLLDGFPIRKSGGLEGFISVADVDGDGAFELIFGSNLLGADGRGFIHAYEMNGGGEVAGFPLRPRGFTFMNGVNPGDIDGDGMMDLVAISYTAHSGSKPDTVYCNAYPLGVAYSPDRVLWSTYKGSNSREGVIADKSVSTLDLPGEDAGLKPYLYPNPAQSRITIRFSLPGSERIHMEIKSIDGRHLQKIKLGELVPGTHSVPIDVNNLPEGTYLISVVRADNRRANLKFVIKQP